MMQKLIEMELSKEIFLYFILTQTITAICYCAIALGATPENTILVETFILCILILKTQFDLAIFELREEVQKHKHCGVEQPGSSLAS
jgi:hypothetical protein